MPLDITSLVAAQVNKSDNAYLMPLWNAVTVYNETGGMNRVASLSKRFEDLRVTSTLPKSTVGTQRQRAMALQDIMYHASGFLTCKPPNANLKKRNARWDAMTDLMADVNREAAEIGVKLVDSPNDFRTINVKKEDFKEKVINPSVWLEVIDPRHREFNFLSDRYVNWMNDANAQKERKSFWKYIGDKVSDYTVLYDKSAEHYVHKNLQGSFTELHGNTVDTTQSESLHSSKGWGIFCVTTDGRLHVGAHSNEDGALVRHTALTNGEPILAGGEICVVNGKIVAISNLTGHYKLGGKQFVKWLMSTNLIEDGVMVKARFDVSGLDLRSDPLNPTEKVKMNVTDDAVAAVKQGDLRKWVLGGKIKDDLPFETDPNLVIAELNAVNWKDLKNPDIEEIVAFEL